MTVYLGRERQCTAQHLTATHATLSELTKKIEGCGHKLYMDNYFSAPDLYETNLLLWHCPTKQEEHATGLRPQENDTGRPSGTY